MKKYLSLILVFAFMLSMIPMSVSADVTDAELKSVTVTGATLIPSLTSGTYTYDVIVDDKEALLPQLNYTLNDNTASYEVLKSADYLGDYTLVKVTDGQTENTYKFTFREPYAVSTTASYSTISKDGTVVRSDRKNDVWATRFNYTSVLSRAGAVESDYIPLISFDLTNADVEPNGKFVYSSVMANKLGYNVELAFVAMNIDDSWSNLTANYNNTIALATNPYGETLGVIDTTDYANYSNISIDITEYVRKLLISGKKTFTLSYDVVPDQKAQINFYRNFEGLNAKYLPTLTYYPVVKSEVATLKSVEIKDALVLDNFSETKYEYNIGVKENETPSFKYILNNSHANAVVTTENNVTKITVTAQDGVTTKVYKFNHKTYEEMGVSETAEIEVSDATLTKNSGTAELKVSFNNLNVNKKKLTFVTLTKKDGVLVGNSLESVTKEYATGSYNDELCATVTLPNDINGVTVEAYIYDTTDTNNKKAVYEKVVFGSEYNNTPVITDTDKKIALMADDSKPGNVIVYGKGAPNEYVTFFVVPVGKALSAFTVAELKANAVVFDMAKINASGIFEKSVTFPDTAGNYVAYLDAETVSESFLHASFSQKKEVIEKIYEEIYKDQDKDIAISAIKTLLGINDDDNITDLVLGIDTSVYTTLTEETVIGILYNVVKEANSQKPSVSADNDVVNFVELYNKAVAISKLNAGIASPVADLISSFNFADSSVLKELLAKVPSEHLSKASDYIVNGALSTAKLATTEDLDDRIRRAILFTSINYPENPAGTQDIIDTYGEYLTLDMSDYNKVNDKANLVSDLVNKGPFASIGTLSTELDKLAGDYLKAQNKPSSQGGGVTSKPSTPVISPAQGTGVTGTGAIYTDDLTVETGKYFGDVENDHWAYESTKYLNEKGILKGMDNGNFEPDRSIKREEFAKILVLAFNLQSREDDKSFTDVNTDEWYAEFVKIASQNGVINGMADGVFGVGVELSRQDIAVMLARVLDTSATESEPFGDDEEISDYAKDAVYTLKNMGVLNGTGNGNFEPQRPVTRAECAKIVYQLIKE